MQFSHRSPRVAAGIIWLGIFTFLLPARGLNLDAIPKEIRARGGLCVILGSSASLAPAEALLAEGPWVIHWLDTEPDRIARAQRALQEQQQVGRVTAEAWREQHLPHADHLVNLVLVLPDSPNIHPEEVERAMAPGGLAMVISGGRTARLEKARPREMGDWTHPWHAPDGNLVASDSALDVPNGFQWISAPTFPLGARKDSTGVILSAGGRMFAVSANVAQNLDRRGSPHHLVARDAFNGLILWTQPWEGPTPRHPGGVHSAVVATADRIYAARREDVVARSAATGEIIETLPLPRARKLLLSDGLLVVESGRGLVAYDLATGEERWNGEDAEHVLIHDGRVFGLTGARQEDGRWRHEVVALDLRTGRELWRQPVESEYGGRSSILRLHFAADGIVTLIERNVLRALSSADGRELWRRETVAEARGEGSMDSRQVGHFYAHGRVWLRHTRQFHGPDGRDAGVPEHWLALDPITGEIVRELTVEGPRGASVGKISCQPLTATQRFVLDARLATIWDFEEGNRGVYRFARGGCQVGMVPANGLGYVPPNACGCLSTQLRGYLGLVHHNDPFLGGEPAIPVVEHGPAYGQPLPKRGNPDAEWRTYRRDSRRSAHSSLPVTLANPSVRWNTLLSPTSDVKDPEWRLRFTRHWSPPTVGEGALLLTEPQGHRVIALDAPTGSIRWEFIAGGRIPLPPTLHEGLALLGAHDGYVYALRADDGALAWRFRAAPSDRRMMAYGRVESAWPVTGGVLVHNGVGVTVAGRAVDADGGFIAHGFDPQTGNVIWTQRVDSGQHGMGDLIVSDGVDVFVLDRRLDLATGERLEGDGEHPHLRGGKAGFQDISWTQLDMGLRKDQLTWSLGRASGQIMASSGDRVYAFQIDGGDRMSSDPRTDGGGRIEARSPNAREPTWAFDVEAPEQVEAMISTPGALFVAGPVNRDEPHGKGFLRVIDPATGEARGQIDLPVSPVHDGLAAAYGRLFAVLRDGSVACLEF